MPVVFRSVVAIGVALMLALAVSYAADEAKAKHTIKEVMKEAHKSGLLKKVASGKGTKEDAEKLVELYESLGQNHPPKGSPESWKSKTSALLEAAEEVVADKPGSHKKLEKAANCAECHKAHKGG